MLTTITFNTERLTLMVLLEQYICEGYMLFMNKLWGITKRAGLSGVKWDLLTALTNESMIKNASNIEEFIDFTLLSK
jgi:hypothetical protein